jgi:putative acetyltransferase
MEGVILRKIQEKDDPLLARIIRNSFLDYNATQKGTVFSDPVIEKLSASFKGERSAYFVAERNGIVLGGAGIQPLKKADPGICELQKMYLDKSERGKGIGRALLEICLDFAKKQSFTSCYLESLPELTDALKLYEASGFSYIKSRLGDTGYYGCSLFMTKKL